MSVVDPTNSMDTAPSASLAASAPVFSKRDTDWLSRFAAMLRASIADGSLFFAVATVAVFMLSRCFQGIEGDSRIYMARALADIDPGVGRDFMFVHDGQSQFSIFPMIADRLVAAFNPSVTSLIFAIVNLVCWLSAAAYLVGRFATGRMKWAILMIVAIVPNFYGPYTLLRFGEQYATPRPLAEACVLFALGLLIERRRVAAGALLVLGALFHPIMTLPGLVIFGLDLCRTDRRWMIAGALGAAVIVIAAALGLPFFDRLATVIDPEWFELLRVRNPYLFPTIWPVEPLGLLTLEMATIVIGAGLVTPRARFVFWAAATAGLGGMVVATIFGDLWPLLLVVQAQLWRMSWLTAVVAAICLALCLLQARERGPRLEVASAILLFGWLFSDEATITFIASASALLFFSLRHLAFNVGRRVLNTIWVLVILGGLVAKLHVGHAFLSFALATPPEGHAQFWLLWNIFLLSIPIGAAAILYGTRSRWMTTKSIALFAAALVVLTACVWDDRALLRKLTDRAQRPADLNAMFADDQSEIYWVGGIEPWYLLGHPSWLLRVQGAGIVFSRPLAMFWRDRLKALVDMDLADENILGPWTIKARETPVQLTRDSVDRLCARPDAPSAIVAAIEEGMPLPENLKFKTWQPIAPQFRLDQKDEAVIWHRIKTFVIVSCADHAPEQHASR